MRRSHYLMSKIAGRIGKDGFPVASEEHHGSAFKYLSDLSPKKIIPESEFEEPHEITNWD